MENVNVMDKLKEQEELNKQLFKLERRIQRLREKINQKYAEKEKEVLEQLKDKLVINGVVNTGQLRNEVELRLGQDEEYVKLVNRMKRVSLKHANIQRIMQINNQWIEVLKK